MLFKVKPCLISRVSEDRQDVHGDKCRLNREVPHEPEPPRATLPPGCCVYATIVRLTNELPAPSAATGHLLREQMTSTVQCLCVQRSLPSLLDKPSSGVGEVMGPEPSVKAPATSTSFQYSVSLRSKRGSAWGLRAACEKSPYPVSSPLNHKLPKGEEKNLF